MKIAPAMATPPASTTPLAPAGAPAPAVPAVPAVPAPPAASASSDWEIIPGGPIPAGAPRTPASQVANKYASDFLAVPGAMSVSWGMVNEVRVYVEDERSAAVAKTLLAPVVNGVPIVIGIYSSRKPYTGDLAPNGSDVIRSISAMTGVWGKTFVGSPNRNGQVTFRTIDQATIDRLDPIITDSFRGGTSKAGIPLMISVRWRAGLPA